MTPEQKKRRAERQREYRAAFSPEQKERKLESFRKWHRNRSPEQIARDLTRDRKRNAAPERKNRQGKLHNSPEGKQRRRENQLKSSYNLTTHQWEQMFVTQGSCCAICKLKDPDGRWRFWHTDHCHSSGKVRGILCHSCNVGLGNFKDNPAYLQSAAEYLTKVN